MNSENPKLRQQQRREFEQTFTEQIASQGHQFASVEELLRFDSGQTPVPPEVMERLDASIAAEPKPGKPWYKTLFG